MNKTVTINLSGIIFNIDEDAYQKLHDYLSAIKGYFSESEGRDEIMSDIENRIAEMLSEKVGSKKQVVQMEDVNHVIAVMGKPEDFAGEKTQEKETKKESSAYHTAKRRRVFRDTDNKILGGVCSGIAAYFNMDPLWLRLALVIAFFVFGTGFLLYLVLWIIIPEAKTSAEKLEMRGEDVNVSNIGKKVEEELHSFGKRMENWGEEVKNTASSIKEKGVVNRFADFVVTVFGALVIAFAKLLGILFIIIGLVFLVGIVSSLFFGTSVIHFNSHSLSIHDFLYSFFEDSGQMFLASLAIILCLGIPMLMLIYGGVKMLLGIKSGNRILNFSAGILWLTGLILAIVVGIQIKNQFVEESYSRQEFTFSQTTCDTLFLRLREVPGWDDRSCFRKKLLHFSFLNHRFLSSDSANLYFDYPTVDIVRGKTDSIEIVIERTAYGSDRKEATYFARNINFEIYQNDSLLELMPYFSIPRDEKWRNQQVHVEVRLPKGKIIYLAKNTRNFLYDIQNETDTYDRDMTGRRWLMGEEELQCVDCEGIREGKTKRWKRHKEIITEDNE